MEQLAATLASVHKFWAYIVLVAGVVGLVASAGGWLASGAVCVIEERADAALAVPDGFTLLHERVYGDTALHFLRKA